MSDKCAACGVLFGQKILIGKIGAMDNYKVISSAIDLGDGDAICVECDFRGRILAAKKTRSPKEMMNAVEGALIRITKKGGK